MDEMAQLTALLDLAEELGIEVRPLSQPGQSSERPGGSLVRLKGKEVIFLEASAGLAEQVGVVAEALAGHAELQQRYLRPEVRQMIESARKQA